MPSAILSPLPTLADQARQKLEQLQQKGYDSRSAMIQATGELLAGGRVRAAIEAGNEVNRQERLAGRDLKQYLDRAVAALPAPDYSKAGFWADRLRRSDLAREAAERVLEGKGVLGDEPVPLDMAQAIAEGPEVFGMPTRYAEIARGYIRRRIAEDDPRAVALAEKLAEWGHELRMARATFRQLEGQLDLELIMKSGLLAPGYFDRPEAQRARWAELDPIGAALDIADAARGPRWIDNYPG
jgi:hypothetical protein